MSQPVQTGLAPEAVQKRIAEAKAALQRFRANPRVSQVVVSVPQDACPACLEIFGTYPKDQVPEIPMDSCSHPLGCRSFYQPFLNDIYP